MRLVEPLKVKCKNCNKVFEVELDFECVSTNERNMGTEFDYEGVSEERCPYCGKDIYIKIEAYEYPIGCIEYTGNYVTDGVEIQKEIRLEPS